MDWSELIAQVIGGAIGVLIGYAASEIIAESRRKQDEQVIREAVRLEMLEIGQEADSYLQELALAEQRKRAAGIASDREAVHVRAWRLMLMARPMFPIRTWEQHIVSSPFAFTTQETSDLSRFYMEARRVVAAWDEYQRMSSTLNSLLPDTWDERQHLVDSSLEHLNAFWRNPGALLPYPKQSWHRRILRRNSP